MKDTLCNTFIMFQVKTLCPELKLATDNDNANLILTKGNVLFSKNTTVEVLNIPSSNLFTVQVLLLEVLKNILLVYHDPTFCSWSTGRKEIIIKF